jgi:hypothetical protein
MAPFWHCQVVRQQPQALQEPGCWQKKTPLQGAPTMSVAVH